MQNYGWIAVGAAMGVVVGTLFGQVGVGVALGAAAGLLVAIYRNRRLDC